MHTKTPWEMGRNVVGSASFRSSTESPALVMSSTRLAGFAAHAATTICVAPSSRMAFSGVPIKPLNRSSTLKMNKPNAMAKLTCFPDSSWTRHNANKHRVSALLIDRQKMPRESSVML